MTVLWTDQEITEALGITCGSSWSATGVSIDSRTIEPGDLFIAIVGPVHDGHEHVVGALENGAAAAIVHRDPTELTSDGMLQVRMVWVNDTLAAMQRLASFARMRGAAEIIAVTGSVGKTGTKEMLRLMLQDQGRTTATEGNLNNHWGLPLSLIRMPKDTEFGIFEIGMSSPGEIIPLSNIAEPDVAVITAVEHVHSEFFESIEDIADAKAEIFSGLQAGGAAVLNIDSPMFGRLAEEVKNSGNSNIRTFGAHPDADYRLTGITRTNFGSQVKASLDGKSVEFGIGVPGRHWVINALGALAAIDAVGGDTLRAVARLKDMHGLKGRGERHGIQIDGGEFILIDESYNASPVSMAAAFEVLGSSPVSGSGRRIAVIGDMLELGDKSEELHTGLAPRLAENGIDLVFSAGQYMAHLWEALPPAMRGGHAMTTAKLSPLVISAVRPGDVVCVKGSLGSRTGLIVSDLLALGNHSQDAEPKVVNGD